MAMLDIERGCDGDGRSILYVYSIPGGFGGNGDVNVTGKHKGSLLTTIVDTFESCNRPSEKKETMRMR